MRRRDDLHADRAPVSTYEDALWRVVSWYEAQATSLAANEADPLTVQLLADVFWVTEAKVRGDLKRYARSF